MERVRQLLSLLIVLIASICFFIWAGWFNDGLDVLDLAKHASKFPLGPDKGPLAGGFLSLFVAWLVYPSAEDTDKRRRR